MQHIASKDRLQASRKHTSRLITDFNSYYHPLHQSIFNNYKHWPKL